jgi:hypothetical protein
MHLILLQFGALKRSFQCKNYSVKLPKLSSNHVENGEKGDDDHLAFQIRSNRRPIRVNITAQRYIPFDHVHFETETLASDITCNKLNRVP